VALHLGFFYWDQPPVSPLLQFLAFAVPQSLVCWITGLFGIGFCAAYAAYCPLLARSIILAILQLPERIIVENQILHAIWKRGLRTFSGLKSLEWLAKPELPIKGMCLQSVFLEYLFVILYLFIT